MLIVWGKPFTPTTLPFSLGMHTDDAVTRRHGRSAPRLGKLNGRSQHVPQVPYIQSDNADRFCGVSIGLWPRRPPVLERRQNLRHVSSLVSK